MIERFFIIYFLMLFPTVYLVAPPAINGSFSEAAIWWVLLLNLFATIMILVFYRTIIKHLSKQVKQELIKDGVIKSPQDTE